LKIGLSSEDVQVGCWCEEEGQAPFTEVTDPAELMALSESANRELAHKLADAALLARMRQLDPEFAAKYERIMQLRDGFWYT
jgi:hypothetical protein